MVTLYYLLHLCMILMSALMVYLLYQKSLVLYDNRQERRLLLQELSLQVTRTTPEKDIHLKQVYKDNKAAIKIIDNAIKEDAPSLQPLKENIFEGGNLPPKSIIKMSRREQILRHLERKRAIRDGEIKQESAKVLNFRTGTEK